MKRQCAASFKATQRTSKAEKASNNPSSESLPGAAEQASTPTTSEGTLSPPEPPSPRSTVAPLLDSTDGDFAATRHNVPSSAGVHISGGKSRPTGPVVAVAGSPAQRSSVLGSLGVVVITIIFFSS